MIKLKDIMFEEGKVAAYTGIRIYAFYPLPDKINECKMTEHIYEPTPELIKVRKKEMLFKIRKSVKEFLNKNGKE